MIRFELAGAQSGGGTALHHGVSATKGLQRPHHHLRTRHGSLYEGYNRQLRKVVKTKGAFPSGDAARKLLYLVTMGITKKWTAPVFNWAKMRNQLAIRFEGRFPL